MPAQPSGSRRALVLTAWLTGIYFVVELAIGLWTGSVAVISDAFHTFSAVGGVLVALVAGALAERPASWSASFGFIRAEIVGALFNGLFLLLMAAWVLWMGWSRLRMPIDLPTGPMLLAAAGGFVTELISIRLLYVGQKESLNVRGAFWHVLQTLVGSVIIVVAAVVIRLTGFTPIDPILGMVFSLVLFVASWGIIRAALDILLDKVPEGFSLKDLTTAVESMRGVVDVHHPHVRTLTSGKNVVTMHVRVTPETLGDGLLKKIQDLLRRDFDVFFSTIQLETECSEPEGTSSISVDSSRGV